MLQIINVLRKYNKSRKEIIREYTGKEGKNNVNVLSLMLFLIRDYLSNGIYSNVAGMYNVKEVPSLFLINRNSELSARGETIKDLDAAVKALL